jgi:hypothetical protein
MEITLNLETGYEKYGNESDSQLDTFAMAIDSTTLNEVENESYEWFDEAMTYAVNEYDHTDDFLATLTKKQREEYAKDIPAFELALSKYSDDIIESANTGELDYDHPLMLAIEKQKEQAYENLYHEWLHGDRSEAGLLVRASRLLGNDLNIDLNIWYDERRDVITIEIPDDEEYSYLLEQHDLAPWRGEAREEDQSYSELLEEQAKEEANAKKFFEEDIQWRAASNYAKKQAAQAKRREEWQKTKEYKDKQKKEANEILRNKILG